MIRCYFGQRVNTFLIMFELNEPYIRKIILVEYIRQKPCLHLNDEEKRVVKLVIIINESNIYQENSITRCQGGDVSARDDSFTLLVYEFTQIIDDLKCFCPQAQVWRRVLLTWSRGWSIKQHWPITSLHNTYITKMTKSWCYLTQNDRDRFDKQFEKMKLKVNVQRIVEHYLRSSAETIRFCFCLNDSKNYTKQLWCK